MDAPLYCKTLLVPYPVSPLVAFAFFLWKRAGIIRDDTYVRYHYHGESSSAPVLFRAGDGVVWKITRATWNKQSDLRRQIESFIWQHVAPDEQQFVKRTLNFWAYGGAEKRQGVKKTERWLAKLAMRGDEPGAILLKAAEYFETYCAEHVDPWRTWLPVPDIETPDVLTVRGIPRGIRPVTIPIFKGEPGNEMDVLHFTTRDLAAGRAWRLRGSSLAIVVGGPSGSGKSTLVATITAVVENVIRSLRSFGGAWTEFSLRIEPITLDLATPTLEAIRAGRGKEKIEADRLKRPWTKELALAALDRACAALRGGTDIVIADLPGQITPITEVVASLADVGIIVANDWEKMDEWRAFMHTMGIALAAELKSAARSSIVTKYDPGKFFQGKVERLDRASRTWDPTVSALTEILFFEILPDFIEQRRKQLGERLRLQQMLE